MADEFNHEYFSMNMKDYCHETDVIREVLNVSHEEDLICAGCQQPIKDEWAEMVNETPLEANAYHSKCLKKLKEEIVEEAKAYAIEQCQVGRSPNYVPVIPPREYMNELRHVYTNYDTLLDELERGTLYGDIYYAAIRARMEFLLDNIVSSSSSSGRVSIGRRIRRIPLGTVSSSQTRNRRCSFFSSRHSSATS
jgi:hypothetical protein